ncbi:MAG: Valine-tRNA ligase [Candidatus Curtissbacteria bacterium GW2011_GWA1_40_16]|uniref:Valine--tRNA ligase n=1 Tax=Candidatus Curtissbacteria bacterium GW2011_GWA1_40_16 TaxID=1618405 RepID=A0A0G0RDZ8_9BACT|nr:MAG: Valine-tRNA ligase [Candidatus Curtissbacteria bacterium GW2011_GWA1_40_16]
MSINFNKDNTYKFWLENGYFKVDLKSKKIPYSLLMPPPNLTGELHLGHAMQHSVLDAVARFKRLQGFNVLLLPGVDHAGIQFESTFDKKIARENLSKQKLGRDKWLEKAWKFKNEVYKSVYSTWRFLGISADWEREVFTLDDGPRRAVFLEFKTFWDKGLIYKGPYIVQWCPKDNTAIENAEVEYEQRKEKLYFLKYGPLTLATARPETKFGDTAMAVHPSDKRYKQYIGQEFEIETLAGKKKMKVIADEAVDPKFGTGVIKVTPGHDFDDYEIGKRHNLPIVTVIDKQGRLTDVAGRYAGMKVLAAREAMQEELKEKGILVKTEDYVHNVAVCERCKSVVEPLISEEWFVKVGEMAKEAVHVINANKIKFLPPNYKKILAEWLIDIHDWCISRSLWWGHRIPVWYPSTRDARSGQVANAKISLDSPGKGWVQDEQVLDTWFSSGLWPMSTLGWPFDFAQGKPTTGGSDKKAGFDPELAKFFPWDFEITAPEIKYLWIARMIMLSKYFAGDIPFKTMFFHGMLRDLEGRKFSKSLGNGIEPQYLIDKWGVDATRMALYSYAIPGRDGRVSKQILDERGKNFRNFGTKLQNIARYVLDLGEPVFSAQRPASKNSDDELILDELEKTTRKVTKNLESLELHLAVDEIYEFVWHRFADKYIESTKGRRDDAQPVLENVLKQVLILLHPFMPFLTEELYQKFDVKRKSIMLEDWPSV